MKIFVSSEQINSRLVKSLIEKLRTKNFAVSHSPRNDRDDSRWSGWYEWRLKEELTQTQIFIALITVNWQLSSWMTCEINVAYKSLRQKEIEKVYFWNPECIKVTALGMIGYLKNELPVDLDELLKVLE